MNKLKFSIITVSYNSEKTIERTINSVLNLTYPNVEYIIIDGASHDNTTGIIKRYESRFNGRMIWKSEPDHGIFDAMNKGIRLASGDIIGIVNSDDWLEANALDVVANAFEANGRGRNAIYCGGIVFHYCNGGKKRMDADIHSFKMWAPLYIMKGVRHPATFVPYPVYQKIGMFNDQMRISADQDFILRCYFGGVAFVAIPQVISNMSEGGISTVESKKSIEMSTIDRRIMLRNFGKTGIRYKWLMSSWKFRVLVKRMLRK